MGGKNKKVTVGYHYRVAYHHGLSATPIDAFLEFRAAEKTAWSGQLTASGTIQINAPNLFGGEKDQGGITGGVDVMFGEPTQQPNVYLSSAFGPQQPGWRGVTTLVFKGGRFGAMNPYPQPPSYKVRVILKGWDDDVPWYPEKAAVPLLSGAVMLEGLGWWYQVEEFAEPNTAWADWNIPATGWLQGGELPFGTGDVYWTKMRSNIWVKRRVTALVDGLTMHIAGENGCVVFVDGTQVGSSNPTNAPINDNMRFPVDLPLTSGRTFEVAAKAFSEINVADDAGNAIDITITGQIPSGMNPAHILYDALTSRDRGAEPVASINDASFRVGADWFFAQGIGLCTEFDPDSETVAQFISRIERVAGCSVSRSPVDGQWHLDIANGVYVHDALPVLTDDDILDYAESPSTLDDVTNSISVEYEDVQQKLIATTPPVQAVGLIDANGVNHDVRQYHELSTAGLATRMAQRDLQAAITPSRSIELTTTRKPFAWRVNTYFRLQAPKRGIDDMVFILAEKSSGTLKSGAMKLTAAQDIYSTPAVSFVQAEPGIDTRPSQTARAITAQRAFETPYIEVAAALSRADLAALPPDVGYAMAVAADPAGNLDYTMMVAPAGGDYDVVDSADWCDTATVTAAASYTDTALTLAPDARVGAVTVGMVALWDDEIVRVDAVDASAGTMTVGRGCADTVPAPHAAGSRLWFYQTAAAADTTEYTDGETINVKLLSNTGSRQLALSAATALPLTFVGRQARPYPPAHLRVNGLDYPTLAPAGDIALSWARRNRTMQADQLIDTTQADIAPEDGQTTTIRIFGESDASLRTADGIAGTTLTYTGADELTDVGGAVVEDPYWANVTALLNFDLPNGTATFNDDQGNAWTCARSAAVSTTSPIFGSGSLLVPYNGYCRSTAQLLPGGTGSYTIELFATPDDISGLSLISCRDGTNIDAPQVQCYGGQMSLYLNTTTAIVSTRTDDMAVGRRTHVELGYDGATQMWYLFADGRLVGTFTRARTTSARTITLGISSYAWNSVQYQGRIDSFRLTSGVCRHTASFAPPTAALGRYTTAPVTGLNGRLRFEVESARAGLASAQRHDLTLYRPGYGNSYGLFYGDAP